MPTAATAAAAACRRPLQLLLPGAPSRRRCLPVVAATRGFGSKAAKKPVRKDGGGDGKQGRRSEAKPAAPVSQGGLDVALQQYDELEAAKKRAEEDAEFAARLALIKAEAAQKKAAGLVPAAKAPAGAPAPARAAFDPPAEDGSIYDNPPSLLSTLQDQLQSDINDPALRQAKIGPGQLGLAGGAVLFGLVFLLVSGGDFATTNRYKGVRPSRPPPDPIEMSRLERQAEGLEARMQADPADLESLEAAAVTYARMQDYGKAAGLLDKLTAARPDDVEAWRLLGESRLLDADSARSVAAYEQATVLRPDDQQLITGLVDAYIANSQQAKAVDYLTRLRSRILEQAGSAPAAAAAAASSGDAATTAAAMPGAQAGDAGAGPSSSGGSSSGGAAVDPVGVQLLLGKSYAAWRGHDQDALAAYDTLVGAFPEDFRGYLAKGVFLRERGRQGDAERMFLQAKFYAPEGMRAFVAARAGERADVGPLPDNGLE